MMNCDPQQVADGVFRVDTHLTRANHTACYLLSDGGELAFIDTGAKAVSAELLALTSEIGGGPEAVRWVIPTHVHLDHAGGVGRLMQACPNARLVVHPRGAPHMIDPSRLQAGATAVYGEAVFQHNFGDLIPVPAERTIKADDGATFALGGRTLTFVDTPGHANHHGCIYDDAARGFYTGDTFGLSYREFDSAEGPWVLATTTPVAFDPDAWMNSLDRMMAFDPECMFLTHFGRLDQPEALVDCLRASIQAHVEIALREEAEGAEDQGRAERLATAVDKLLVSEGHERAPHLTVEQVRSLLALDLELNAQGLHVWLRRRSRA